MNNFKINCGSWQKLQICISFIKTRKENFLAKKAIKIKQSNKHTGKFPSYCFQ